MNNNIKDQPDVNDKVAITIDNKSNLISDVIAKIKPRKETLATDDQILKKLLHNKYKATNIYQAENMCYVTYKVNIKKSNTLSISPETIQNYNLSQFVTSKKKSNIFIRENDKIGSFLKGYYNSVFTLYNRDDIPFTCGKIISFDRMFFSGNFLVSRVKGDSIQAFKREDKLCKMKCSYLLVIKASNLTLEDKGPFPYLKIKQTLQLKKNGYLILTPEYLQMIKKTNRTGQLRCWRLKPHRKKTNILQMTGQLVNLLDHNYIYPLAHISDIKRI